MNIRKSHWKHFEKLCCEVEQGSLIGFDRGNIRNVLLDHTGGLFTPGMSAACAAAKEPFLEMLNARRVPLLAMSCGAPQERDGFKESSLAIKILDQVRPNPSGLFSFPVAYDVFLSGRRILEIFGLRLDSEQDDGCRYEPASSFADDLARLVAVVPEYDSLVRTMMEGFPGTGPRLMRIRNTVLEELSPSLS